MEEDVRSAVSQLSWVHSSDLGNGLLTRSKHKHPHVRMVVDLLRSMNLHGRSCLDVGTQDGGMAFEMEKKGAQLVVAIDIQDRPQFRLAHSLLKSRVRYLPDFHVDDLQARMAAEALGPFDLVLCSGVLYHVRDPLGVLVQIRNIMKPGGLAVIATACIGSEEIAMYFNAAGGIINEPTTFWLPTASCVKYLMKACSFKILHEEWTWGEKPLRNRRRALALVARAVKPSIAMSHDEWLNDVRLMAGWRQEIWRPLNFRSLEAQEPVDPIPYRESAESTQFCAGVMSLAELARLEVRSRTQRLARRVSRRLGRLRE